MDIEIGTRKQTPTVVTWTVGIPRVGESVKSKSFLVLDDSWDLEFFTHCHDCNKETWVIKLYHSSDVNPPRFPIIVYVRGKGRDLYLCKCMIYTPDIQVIWSSNYSSFKEKYPHIQVVGTPLQFVIDFYIGIPNPETPINGKKSVQISDLIPENLTCLENLSLDLSKLVESGTETDVQLKCGDVSIGAHKLILGARSEVFRTMMQSDMVEVREGIVEIIDMEPKVLEIFIKYIYTGIFPELTVDTVLPIYEAADKYQVGALKKRSSQFLVKNLSPENALGIFVIADAHSDSELKDQLMHYIIKEKMPSRKVEWLKFCNERPKLANEVLNLFYDLPSVSQ